MPPVSASDRKVLLIAGAAFITLVVLGLVLAPADDQTSVASTYSVASRGAKAAYLLLQESGYHVQRWQRPVTDLKSSKNTVLIIADPRMVAGSKDKEALEQFMSAGGRVITNGIFGASFLPDDASETNQVPREPWTEFPAAEPSAITRAAPKIKLAPASFWKDGSSIPLYGNKDNTVAVRLRRGDGDAIWLASATPLTNAGLQESGNLDFVLAAIGDKDHTQVLFDEFVHGYGDHDVPERSHPLMSALLLQSLVLAVAILFTYSRRSGPMRPMPVESRLSPLEFVETLGGLYENAHAAAVAVDVSYQRFQFWITRRLGLTKDASPEEIDRAVRERWRWKDEKFLDTLRSAASARYYPGLPQKQALEIVQSLYSYALKLKLFSFAKEKN